MFHTISVNPPKQPQIMEYVPSPKVYEVCFWKRTINSTIISILTVLLGPPTSSPLSVSTTSGSLHMFASAFVPTVSVVVTNTFSPDPPLLSLSRPMNLGSAGDIRVHVHTPYSSRSSSCMSASDAESSRSIRSTRFCILIRFDRLCATDSAPLVPSAPCAAECCWHLLCPSRLTPMASLCFLLPGSPVIECGLSLLH